VDRDRLVRETLPLVARVAGAIGSRLPHSVEMSDLTQAGVLGLLDAADKFDRAKGVRFRTYAELRIRGAILDSLRSLDWVPRSLRRQRREIQRAESGLEAKLGRKPTDEELASVMELSLSELGAARERVRRAEVASFGTESFDRVVALTLDPSSPNPLELLERREMENLLALAIEKLPTRERLVLTLYYHEELTMKEVGGVLGVNESRVSQIHSKAVSKLRLRLRRDLRPRAILVKSVQSGTISLHDLPRGADPLEGRPRRGRGR
jgi:RNA polymerase sigma factor for flagellar operon FliA